MRSFHNMHLEIKQGNFKHLTTYEKDPRTAFLEFSCSDFRSGLAFPLLSAASLGTLAGS